MFAIILFALIGAKLGMGVAYWVIFGVLAIVTLIVTIIDIANRWARR